MTIEQLTDDVRARLALAGHEGPTALRIIDAHAADRAALVARVAELERELSSTASVSQYNSVMADNSRLCSELESAKRYIQSFTNASEKTGVSLRLRLQAAESEVTRLLAERAALVAQLEAANVAKSSWERLRHDAYALYRAEADKLEAANVLLARTQDASAKRPREVCSDQVQLDYDIGRHLQCAGYVWDASRRRWVHHAR